MLELMPNPEDETFAQIMAEGNYVEPSADKDVPQASDVTGVKVENPLSGVSIEARCAETSYRKGSITSRQLDKLRKAQAQARHDYHGDTVKKAYERLNGHLSESLAAGHDVIELVHGKGTGALREAVRGWLFNCSYVLAFTEQRANSGSVLVKLKAKAGK